ncbi:hypothetical protein B0A48_03691 [Cryoendolithus antarcticus]|uniref:Uncharacterized protein n=1 Tax=Cryoendolithus antarcticus TaxID=1507870 RepID=A0A1V8TG93_9PEZI|nr:hypothetical protein B0A48_03691 [Cryoendolithus antarcticus]
MTQSMRDALKGKGGQSDGISSSVADVLGNSYDTRGKKQKAADEANVQLKGLGTSAGPTVESKSVKAKDQIANQSSGNADHLNMGMRKQT